MDFLFLTSNRFWALVIASLAIVSNGGFTEQAWTNGVIALVGGFVTVRTVDRATE